MTPPSAIVMMSPNSWRLARSIRVSGTWAKWSPSGQLGSESERGPPRSERGSISLSNHQVPHNAIPLGRRALVIPPSPWEDEIDSREVGIGDNDQGCGTACRSLTGDGIPRAQW